MGIRFIQPVKPDLAEGLVAEVYTQIKRDFGRIVEPFSLHSPIPRLLAGVWMASRESELVGVVPRGSKEAIAATISRINQCPYCVDAHGIMLNASNERSIATAIAEGTYNQISNLEKRLLVEWALTTLTPGSRILNEPPFTLDAAPEIIGTAVFFHYINRMVNALLTETPLPSKNQLLKRPLMWVATLFFSRAIKRVKKEGDSLSLLPEAKLPSDLGWANSKPNIAGAFARLSAIIDEVGSHSLSSKVRSFVKERVATWNGEFPKPSKSWVEKIITDFTGSERATAKLALLVALAPYQIGKYDILAFRNHFPEDNKLLGVLAWASFTAARKIGTWLHIPKI